MFLQESSTSSFFQVTPTAHFQNDLGLDSLDAVENDMALEEEFGFELPENEADKINYVDMAVDFIDSSPGKIRELICSFNFFHSLCSVYLRRREGGKADFEINIWNNYLICFPTLLYAARHSKISKVLLENKCLLLF
ncbi:uncharacterized protein A4U43_C02F14030 [Asparagus officinalis]|uniref:Acyl carrier protein n=1 Tax=Asparagus officinalis TaxID=4686 RepID=A0A5P1FI54_ASPOF|nr:uncharacterized protein A4U43_C02F14030 [Asparagus officinalis]